MCPPEKKAYYRKSSATFAHYGRIFLPNPVFSEVKFLKQYSGKPGAYEILVTFNKWFNRQGKIKAILFVPKKVALKQPLLVFFYGEPKKPNYYKNLERTLKQWSAKKGALLLSIRGRGIYYPNLSAAYSTAEILEVLIRKGQASKDRIYAIGHDTGGISALCAAVHRPDLITGFLPNKSVFGEGPTDGCLRSYERELWGRPENSGRLVHQLRGATVLGGERDHPRARLQLPQARVYLRENLGLKMLNRDFPEEGHNFSYKSFNLIWELMK